MSRKDYNAVAAFINSALQNIPLPDDDVDKEYDVGYEQGIVDAAKGLAEIFARENERFETQRFLRACGL